MENIEYVISHERINKMNAVIKQRVLWSALLAICFVFLWGAGAGAYDSEKNHTDLANETLELYVRLYGSTLPNGVGLDTKLTGEVVTSDGILKSVNLSVKDWIILGAAEEDWGGNRKNAHYYDPKNTSTPGRSFYPSGALNWIHDAAGQSSYFIVASGQAYASGDYSYETFRDLYANSPNDARTYRTLGHILHVLADMGSPGHVRGLKESDRVAFEGRLKTFGVNDMLTNLLSGLGSAASTGYLKQNRSVLGIDALTTTNIPSYASVDQYFSALAEYANTNFYTQTTLYLTSYTVPPLPTLPPASPPFVIAEALDSNGQKVQVYTYNGMILFARSIIANSNLGWNGLVRLSGPVHVNYYRALAPMIIRYGVGLLNDALQPNTVPTASVTSFGQGSGNISIFYKLTDAEADTCRITVQYSTDNGLTYSDCSAGSGGDGLTGLSSSATGVTHQYNWNSEADLPLNEYSVIVKITPYDSQTGVASASDSFAVINVFQPPVATIVEPSGNLFGNVTTSFTVKDADFSLATVYIQYSTDGGTNYSDVTLGTGSDPLTAVETTPAGKVYTFVWDTLTDLGLVKNSNIKLRIYASDAVSGNGAASATNAFEVNNSDPRAVVSTPSGLQTSAVTISYKLFDPGYTLTNITVEYSVNNGVDWFAATLSGGDGINSLTTAPLPDGVEHTVVWDFITDVGSLYKPETKFRINVAGGVGDTTDVFAIDHSPAVVISSPAADAVKDHDVPIVFTLTSDDPVSVDLKVQFSLDGVNFYDATSAPYGSGITSLNSTPGSLQHTFYWSSYADISSLSGLYGYSDNDTVTVRISANQGASYTASNVFKVYNKTGIAQVGWPKQFGFSLENHQKSIYNGPASPTLRWTGPLRTQDWVAPVIGLDGTIYIAGGNSLGKQGLFALNPEDGSLKWFLQCYTEWPRTTPVILADGRIYYLTRISGYSGSEYQLLCLTDDGNQATVNWAFDTKYFSNQASPNVDVDGTIYVPCVNTSSYYGVKAITDLGGSAEEKWFYYHGSYTAYPKTVVSIYQPGNIITFGDYNYYVVYGVNRTSGAQAWAQSFSYGYKGTLVPFGDKLYMTDGYYRKRLNISTGASEWSVNAPCCTDSFAYMTPAISYNDYILFNFYNNYRYIYGYDTSLTLKWTYNDPNSQYPRGYFATCPDNTFFIRCGNYLRKIDATNGTIVAGWNAVNLVQARSFTGLAIGADENIYTPGRNDVDSFGCYGDNKPVVQALTPSTASDTVPVTIKIYGGGFTTTAGGGGGATEVKLKKGVDEQILATYTVANYSTIYAKVPAGLAAGDWDVIVTTPNGANVTSNAKLTITSP